MMKKNITMFMSLVVTLSMNAQMMDSEEKVVANQIENNVIAEASTSATTGVAKRTGDIDVKWIQLWENGPKFAEYNVGVTNAHIEDYGGFHSWGGTTDKEPTSDLDGKKGEDTDPLSSTDDIATNLWGKNWRMPTQNEFQSLLDNCNVKWTSVNGVSGCKFIGRGVYAGNSLFLPAAGGCYDTCDYFVCKPKLNGRYWSSTPLGDDNAYCLYLKKDRQNVKNRFRYYRFPVRAVLVE